MYSLKIKFIFLKLLPSPTVIQSSSLSSPSLVVVVVPSPVVVVVPSPVVVVVPLSVVVVPLSVVVVPLSVVVVPEVFVLVPFSKLLDWIRFVVLSSEQTVESSPEGQSLKVPQEVPE